MCEKCVKEWLTLQPQASAWAGHVPPLPAHTITARCWLQHDNACECGTMLAAAWHNVCESGTTPAAAWHNAWQGY